MVQEGKIIRVLIASPSDVIEEREAVDEIFNRWNAMHSWALAVSLEAVKWETHATPFQGTRPQEQINKQLVMRCDVFLGIFGNRLGSDTGVAVSGTVEELNQFLEVGKPALLYFSQKQVSPTSIDPKQLEKLRKFKQTIRGKGLQYDFDDVESFKLDVLKHLTDVVHLLLHHVNEKDNADKELENPQVESLGLETGSLLAKTDFSQSELESFVHAENADHVLVRYFANASLAGLAGLPGSNKSRSAELYIKADEMAKQGKLRIAIRQISDSISENPIAQAFYNRGMFRLSADELSLAIDDFDKALSLASIPQAAYNAGICCWRISQDENTDRTKFSEERIVQYFEKTLQLDHTFAEASYNLGVYYLPSNFEKSIEHFTAAYETNSYFAEAAFNLGLAYLLKGNRDKATETFEKAFGLDDSYRTYLPSFDEISKKGKVLLERIENMEVSGPVGPTGP